MTNNSLTEIAAVLNRSRNVAIVCHVRPDGDALGSALALGCGPYAGKIAHFSRYGFYLSELARALQ